MLHAWFWQNFPDILICPLINITGKFSRRSPSVCLCLTSPTIFPKHLANERNPNLTFDLPRSPQNNDPSSSTAFKSECSLSWRETAEPSGRTAFLTDTANYVVMFLSLHCFVFCLFLVIHAPAHNLLTYIFLIMFFIYIFPLSLLFQVLSYLFFSGRRKISFDLICPTYTWIMFTTIL